MRRSSSSLSDRSNESRKTPYLDVISVGIVHFFLSLLVFCYGVFLMQFVLKDFCSVETSLWTAVAFVGTSKITHPWVRSYCKHLDNVRHRAHRRNIVATALVLFTDLVAVSLFNTPQAQIIFYGVLGGSLSSVILVHLRYATDESFKSQTHVFDIITQITKPLSLIFMPHVVLLLTNLYGTDRAQLVLSAVILNIVPACLLIRKKSYQRTKLCKFQTVDRLSIEMADLHRSSSVAESSSSSSEEDDESAEAEAVEGDSSESQPPEPSANHVQKYFFENFGVKILPNIPEEDETDDDDDDINEISSKRVSRISVFLQELNENYPKPSVSQTNLFRPDEVADDVQNESQSVADEITLRKSRCPRIISSISFEWEMRKSQAKSFLRQSVIRPIPRTLSMIHFYPVLISNCITTFLSTIIFATAPYLMYLKNEHKSASYPNTTEEATFLLTIIGFTWLFYLAAYPIFSALSPFKIKILFLLGLSISGISLFIAHEFSYDNFTLFSLTFGLGHGIVNYSENTAHRTFFGEKRWRITEGALEMSTGLTVILVYAIIYYNNYLQLRVLLSYAYWLYVFDVALWMTAYVLQYLVVRFRRVGRYNIQKYHKYEFQY